MTCNLFASFVQRSSDEKMIAMMKTKLNLVLLNDSAWKNVMANNMMWLLYYNQILAWNVRFMSPEQIQFVWSTSTLARRGELFNREIWMQILKAHAHRPRRPMGLEANEATNLASALLERGWTGFSPYFNSSFVSLLLLLLDCRFVAERCWRRGIILSSPGHKRASGRAVGFQLGVTFHSTMFDVHGWCHVWELRFDRSTCGDFLVSSGPGRMAFRRFQVNRIHTHQLMVAAVECCLKFGVGWN